jgi:tetraacyldisaccharide 4'-kinase
VAGDEPYLLAKITPAIVAVAADRLKAAALALNQGADILILDDGFQRLSFARDVDVLALTGPRPFGDGLVFPAGPLRERLAAGSAADLVVASNDSPPNPWGRPQFTASLDLTALTINNSRETLPLSFARKVRLAAFCGLGNPQNFFASLKAWDLAPVASLAWPDHVRYGADHIKRLRRFYRFSQAEWLVTTAKDAVKLVGQNLPPLLVAETTLRLEKPGEFLDLILGALKRRGHGL